MTIALGILAKEGAVLAADREESYGDVLKSDTSKVDAFVYIGSAGGYVPLAVGAGYSHYIEAFIQHLEQDFRIESPKGKKPEEIIRKAIGKFYRDHVIPFAHYPADERPDFDMIIAHPCKEGVCLFETAMTTVRRKSPFSAIGNGAPAARAMLNLIIPRWGLIGIDDAALVASYVLHRVKETVPGCGKQTDLFAMFANGGVARALPGTEDRLDELMKYFHEEIGPLVLRSAIGNLSPDRVVRAIEKMRDDVAPIKNRIGWSNQGEQRSQKSPMRDPKPQLPSPESRGESDES